MKQEEILRSIAVPAHTPTMKKHATGIAAIYGLFEKERSNITSVSEVPTSLDFGKFDGEIKGKKVSVSGTKLEAKKITVSTNRGTYSVVVPDKTPIYSSFCKLLNIKNEENMKKEKSKEQKPLLQFKVPATFYDCLKKAKEFASKDKLRPALTCILIEIVKDTVKIISTNAHFLYMSREFKVELIGKTEETKFLILADDLPKERVKDDFEVAIYDKEISLLGSTIHLFTEGTYIDYKVVLPDYDRSVSFNRRTMIESVNQVYTYSNKSTAAVDIIFNGNILLHAQDVDFSTEASAQMNWVTKTVRDCAISFSANFLRTTLQNLTGENVTMWTAGSGSKPCLFSDGVDTILLMPVSNHMEKEYLPEQYSEKVAVSEREKAKVVTMEAKKEKEPKQKKEKKEYIHDFYGDDELNNLQKEFGLRYVFDKSAEGKYSALAIDEYPVEVATEVSPIEFFKFKVKEWEKKNPDATPNRDVLTEPKKKERKVKVVNGEVRISKKFAHLPIGLSYEEWLQTWGRWKGFQDAIRDNDTVRIDRLTRQSKSTYSKYQKADARRQKYLSIN